MKKTATLFLFLIQGAALHGQSNMDIIINSNNTTTPPFVLPAHTYLDLAPELAGSDVSIMNPSMNSFGSYILSSVCPIFYGKFVFNGPSDIGIDSGLVLSSGFVPKINNAPNQPIPGSYSGISWPALYNSGAYYPGGRSILGFSSISHRWDQYDDLVAMNNGDSIADANILDFDFVPQGGSIRLEYVFASEEYPEHVCDTPQDVMAIFLSRPGIPGYENIALIPGTNIPVGVNSISPPGAACDPERDYSQYYVDNTGGQNVIFNGFTQVMTASASVNPCDTYHLRIAVADGALHDDDSITLALDGGPRQGLYDSGIFLKFGSLRSTDTLWAEARGGGGQDSISPYAVASCLPAAFRLYRGTPVNAPLTLSYTLSGTAVNGIDYSFLSGTATIPANAAYVDVPVNALTAAAISPKTVKLILQSPYTAPCATMAAGNLDSAIITIYGALQANIPLTDTTICTGCSMQLIVEGDPGLQYAWSPATGLNNTAVQSPVATPPQTTLYFMTAAAPPCPSVTDSIYVQVGNLGIETQNNDLGISLSPNPFRERFRIEMEKDPGTIYQLRMNDMEGNPVLALEGNIEKLNQQLSSPVSQLSPGNYLVQITDKETKQQSTFKLAKIN